jgi:hypothetical protein
MMEPNQNPPSERDWTEQEKDEFFASQDAVTGLFSGAVAYNGVPNASTKPLTLDMLIKMKEDFDKQFPEPLKYKNGADMSGETFHALGASLGFPTMLSENGGQSWIDPHFNPIIGIEIHIVPGMPFGAVEECRCKERYKIKFQTLNPLPPQDLPSMVEIVQEMSIDEAKKRWPNTPIPGEKP